MALIMLMGELFLFDYFFQQNLRYFYQLMKSNNDLEENERLKISLRKGKMVVNNSMVTKKMSMPDPVDIIIIIIIIIIINCLFSDK